MDIEQIYRRYGAIVFRYLMSLCHNVDLAEELTQETFCRAIYSVHKYDGSCKISTWLCQIAKHLWYQELDRRARKGTVPLPDTEMAETGAVEDQVVLRQEKMGLFRKIHGLNETEKEVVFLRLTGEMSFREIGEIFQRTENWARVTFYRAKQKLKGADSE